MLTKYGWTLQMRGASIKSREEWGKISFRQNLSHFPPFRIRRCPMAKRFFGLLLFLSLAFGPTFLSAPPDQVLTILHASDTHSALLPFGPQDKLEGIYDGMELGNHEFDLGLDVLTGVFTGAALEKEPLNLPILCANIDETKLATDPDYQPYGPVLASIIEPNKIEELAGIKVGIFGLVNTDPQNYSELALGVLTDPIAAAPVQVNELKVNQGCDVVICLPHPGTMADEMDLSAVPGIDIILGGHSHDSFADPFTAASGAIVVEGGE